MACTLADVCLDRRIFAGDIGTLFKLIVCNCDELADLSNNISLEIRFEKPDKTLVIQPAVLSTDGTDGAMQYIVVDGDLDQVGSWRIHGKVELPTGTWYTDISKFKTYEPIPGV